MYITKIFHSIQGEGIYIGRRAIFVRFWGCSKKCAFCDTPQAQEEGNKKELTVLELISQIISVSEETSTKLVVLTGGEPTEQPFDLHVLAKELKERNIDTILETNGTGVGIDYAVFSHVCISPKDSNVNVTDPLMCASVCFKFLVDPSNPNDALMLYQSLNIPEDVPIIVQPQHDPNREYLDEDADSVDFLGELIEKDEFDRHLDVRYLPQLHKILGIE